MKKNSRILFAHRLAVNSAVAAAILAAGCKGSNDVAGVPIPGTSTPRPTVTSTAVPSSTPVSHTAIPTATTTATSTPRPTATPPPIPAGTNISGTWTGTFVSVGSTLECYAGTPATATFTQHGSAFTGSLDAPDNPCGFAHVTFEGTVGKSEISGTITGDRFVNATAQGTYKLTSYEGDSYERLTLRITDGIGYIPGGEMILPNHQR